MELLFSMLSKTLIVSLLYLRDIFKMHDSMDGPLLFMRVTQSVTYTCHN